MIYSLATSSTTSLHLRELVDERRLAKDRRCEDDESDGTAIVGVGFLRVLGHPDAQ